MKDVLSAVQMLMAIILHTLMMMMETLCHFEMVMVMSIAIPTLRVAYQVTLAFLMAAVPPSAMTALVALQLSQTQIIPLPTSFMMMRITW